MANERAEKLGNWSHSLLLLLLNISFKQYLYLIDDNHSRSVCPVNWLIYRHHMAIFAFEIRLFLNIIPSKSIDSLWLPSENRLERINENFFLCFFLLLFIWRFYQLKYNTKRCLVFVMIISINIASSSHTIALFIQFAWIWLLCVVRCSQLSARSIATTIIKQVNKCDTINIYLRR